MNIIKLWWTPIRLGTNKNCIIATSMRKKNTDMSPNSLGKESVINTIVWKQFLCFYIYSYMSTLSDNIEPCIMSWQTWWLWQWADAMVLSQLTHNHIGCESANLLCVGYNVAGQFPDNLMPVLANVWWDQICYSICCELQNVHLKRCIFIFKLPSITIR